MSETINIQDNNQALMYLMEGEFYLPLEAVQQNGIGYKGGYQKKVLLLVNESLRPTTKDLLNRILTFAGLNASDYALVTSDEWGSRSTDYIVNSFQPEKIIAWGETIFSMLPVFANEQYNGIPTVSCISLSALEKNVDAKKSLASAIKNLLV